MTTKYYDFFGPIDQVSIFKTHEAKINSNYIYYYENTLSSIAYLFSAIFIFHNLKKTNNLNIEHAIIIINLFFISFISFLWWASQRKYIHQIDIVLYSNLIVLIGLYTLFKKNIITQLVFINLFTIFLGIIIFLVKTNNHNLIKQINIGSGLFSGYSLIMYTNYYKILFIFIISIMFKLNDTYNFNNCYLFISGTAWFHILSALGYSMLLS
jgi:hypothetical protein